MLAYMLAAHVILLRQMGADSKLSEPIKYAQHKQSPTWTIYLDID